MSVMRVDERTTEQEVLDHAARHLFEQGRQAVVFPEGDPSDTTCAYRGENGTARAVECLIPDELYSPRLEGKGISALMKRGRFEHRKRFWSRCRRSTTATALGRAPRP